jgi:hypothetical protein
MKIKTVASQLKITRSLSTLNISKTINAHTNDDHLFDHGQCPRGNCDAGWKPNTCSEGKLFLLSYNILC